MKNLVKAFVIVMIVTGFSVSSFAQVSATATSSATVVTPIAITETANMLFGNVAVQASNDGTVIMTPASSRSATGGVTLPVVTGTFNAAAFSITGQPNYTYAITLPSTVTTISDGATHTMTVDTWTSSPTPTGTLSGSGSQTLSVGATLHVTGGQPAGTYTSGTPFTVTVNYN